MKKIAIPVDVNNQIEDHFGHCDHYKIFSISNENEIVKKETIQAEEDCGCKSNIAFVLAENGITVMLAGGIGAGAVNVLNQCNIDVIKGCFGATNEIVRNYLEGNLIDRGEVCAHHEHGEDHQCSH